MDINMIQNMQQEQKLILTNEMRLSLQLLQMPIIDLQELIEIELDENPLLEIDYDISDDMEMTDDKNDLNELESFDYDKLINSHNQDHYDGELTYNNPGDDYSNNPLNYIAQPASLKDYLKEQLIDYQVKKEIIAICEYLIDIINEDGFITEETQEIAFELKKPYELVESALLIIKDLQPWGIGAKDFRECLMIQLKKKHCYDEKLQAIITKHLELLAENKIKELAKILNVTIEIAQQYANTIKSLEPKPARGFYTGEEIGYIVPEAFIKRIGSDYYIIMNDSILPRLNVNSYYQRIIKEKSNQETISFMKDKVNSALSLIKGIEQRRKTIYRILEKIIEYQKDYFDQGEAHIKPMSLKDLSTELNLHESTVSRAIKDKYISIPKGTIRLKDIFTNGINSAKGEENISTNTVKKVIVQLIKSENKKNPLSDQEICELLRNENINISRRTVAKYREELGIGSSGKRKAY